MDIGHCQLLTVHWTAHSPPTNKPYFFLSESISSFTHFVGHFPLSTSSKRANINNKFDIKCYFFLKHFIRQTCSTVTNGNSYSKPLHPHVVRWLFCCLSFIACGSVSFMCIQNWSSAISGSQTCRSILFYLLLSALHASAYRISLLGSLKCIK